MDDYKALAVCWDWTVSTGVHNPLKKGVIVFSSIHYYFLPYSNFYMQFIKEKKNTQERKQELLQENLRKKIVQENTTNKNRTRNLPRKQELVQENRHENTHSFLLCQFFF